MPLPINRHVGAPTICWKLHSLDLIFTPSDRDWETGAEIVYLETQLVEFSNSSSEDVITSKEYSNPVILTSATDNVNVFVSNYQTINGVTVITVETSASITGSVYVAIGEAT